MIGFGMNLWLWTSFLNDKYVYGGEMEMMQEIRLGTRMVVVGGGDLEGTTTTRFCDGGTSDAREHAMASIVGG